LGNLPAFMSEDILQNHSHIENIESFEPFHKLIRGGDYLEAYKWLDQENDSDLKTMYALLWEDVFARQFGIDDHDDFVAYYRESTGTITNTWISNILRVIKRYNNWF